MDQDVHGIAYRAIGILRSPFTDIKGMPVQPVGALGVAGHVEVHADFADGLRDLEGFSHVFLLYHLHRVAGFDLVVRPCGPFPGQPDTGIFANPVAKRAQSIGLSCLELRYFGLDRGTCANVDVPDGTPVPPYQARTWPQFRCSGRRAGSACRKKRP